MSMFPTLLNADCLEAMKLIPDGYVDLVFTSPPYNMNLRIRNGKYCSRQITKELTTKYVDFKDNLPMDDYFHFTAKVISECLRVSDLVAYNVQFLTGNKPALFKTLGHFSDKIKDIIVWDKINAQPAIGQGVMNSQFEVILLLQNSYPQSRSFGRGSFPRGTLSNLWRVKKEKKVNKNHGAVFPLALAHKVVSSFSKEDAVVMDCFMGTGTTGVACAELGRRFIGIESNKSYFDFAVDRITSAAEKKK